MRHGVESIRNHTHIHNNIDFFSKKHIKPAFQCLRMLIALLKFTSGTHLGVNNPPIVQFLVWSILSLLDFLLSGCGNVWMHKSALFNLCSFWWDTNGPIAFDTENVLHNRLERWRINDCIIFFFLCRIVSNFNILKTMTLNVVNVCSCDSCVFFYWSHQVNSLLTQW